MHGCLGSDESVVYHVHVSRRDGRLVGGFGYTTKREIGLSRDGGGVRYIFTVIVFDFDRNIKRDGFCDPFFGTQFILPMSAYYVNANIFASDM